MDLWPELVELYEYKVADVLSGRDPRGGRRSVYVLRDALISAELEPSLLKRFRRTDRLWRDHGTPGESPIIVSAQNQAEWVAPSREPPDAEGAVLTALSRRLWRLRLDDQLEQLTTGWRREPGLASLRGLYALSMNLESGEVQHAIPTESDPLVSLGNPQVALGIVLGLVDQMFNLNTPTRTALGWARTMVAEMLSNPTRASGNSPRSTSIGPVRDALPQALDALARLLPIEVGGAGPPPTEVEMALFAASPHRRLEAPGPERQLAVHLTRPGEIAWHGHHVGWQNVSGTWHIRMHGATYPLVPGPGGTHTRIPFEGAELRAVLSDEYLMLELTDADHPPLHKLLALGRAVATLLEPEADYLNLRVARGAAQWLRDGRVDLPSLAASQGARYAAAPPETLVAFARKGVENLLVRLERRSAREVERAFREAARPLGCSDEQAKRLSVLLIDAYRPATPVESRSPNRPGEAITVAWDGEPLAVPVAGRTVTIRADGRGLVSAVMPGAPATNVADFGVLRVQDGSVVVARQGLRFQVGFQAVATAVT